MLHGSVSAGLGDVLSKPKEGFRALVAIERFVGEDGIRMEFRCISALLDVDGASVVRNGDDAAEFLSAHASEIALRPEVGILKDELVPMDRSLIRTAGLLQEGQSGEAGTFVKKVLGGKIAKPKVLPPNGLLLPTVPVQHE